MILGFLFGVYVTLGVVLAAWYYLDDMPSWDDTPRKWKAIQAVVLGVFWPCIVPGTVAAVLLEV